MFGLATPAALFALALAGVPILLFLITRRRLRVEEFPAAVLVAELGYVRTNRARLLERLLLLIRILLVAGVVFAAAGAFLVPPSSMANWFKPKEATPILVLIDDSPSMARMITPDKSIYDDSWSIADAIVARLDRGGNVHVARISGRKREEAFPDYRAFRGSAMTTAVRRELAEFTEQPVLVLLTDGAVTDVGPVGQVSAAYVVDVTNGLPIVDAAVSDVTTAAPVVLAGQGFAVNVAIAGTSGVNETELTLSDEKGENVYRRQKVNLSPSGEEAGANVNVDIPPGPEGLAVYKLEVSSPVDRYAVNNVVYLPVNRVRAPKVVLSGEKAELLKTALFPTGTAFVDGLAGGMTQPEDLKEALDGVDVVVWVGDKACDEAVGGSLLGFTADGGGVVDVRGLSENGGPGAVSRIDDAVPEAVGAAGILASLLPPKMKSWIYAPEVTKDGQAIVYVSGAKGRGAAVFMKQSGAGFCLTCGLDFRTLGETNAAYLPAILRELIRLAAHLPAPMVMGQAGSEIDALMPDEKGVFHEEDGKLTKFTGTLFLTAAKYPAAEVFSPSENGLKRGIGVLVPDSERYPWRYKAVDAFAKEKGWENAVVSPGDLWQALGEKLLSVPLAGLIGVICVILALMDALLGNILAAQRTSAKSAPGRERLVT